MKQISIKETEMFEIIKTEPLETVCHTCGTQLRATLYTNNTIHLLCLYCDRIPIRKEL